MRAPILICIGSLLLSAAYGQSDSTPRGQPPEVTQLISSLPPCSGLRDKLEHERFGDGVEKPYMRPMLDQGVQRAHFELRGKWRHERAEDVRIVKRLYYSELDGPDAQITDVTRLKEIEISGLAAMLDDAVRMRVADARLFSGIDRWAGLGITGRWRWQLTGSYVYGSIDLFASGWLNPTRPDLVFPGKLRESLMQSAMIGDVSSLSGLLKTNHYSQLELNQALTFAVASPWDNTSAINLLLKTGADVNSRFNDGATPLMLVYDSPCNASALLARGAHLEDRDNSGRTAVDRARQRHDAALLRVLEGAK
jgi:hypothetical protein